MYTPPPPPPPLHMLLYICKYICDHYIAMIMCKLKILHLCT